VAPPASRSSSAVLAMSNERTGGREVVWELARDGVGSTACSEEAFIGQEAGGKDGQKVAGAGGSGDVHGQSRARRPWGRAGGVRSWRRGTVGMRWQAHAGRHRAERQRERRGGPGGFIPFLPCLMARVGAEEAGARPRGVHEHGYRARTNGNSVGHSSFDFSWISPTKCSVKCPQEFKIQIFEKFHFGLST
jgi:hypothetical protein